MNDPQIRTSFHKKRLFRHHRNKKTLVIDELALQHGKCRADIALVNGHLIGYEIKSEVDSLDRLNDQIIYYNSVFDCSSIIVTESHLRKVMVMLPNWWGVISANKGSRGAIHFKTIRPPKRNIFVDDYAVAQLLWRSEAKEILSSLGVQGKKLREKRSNLYRYIVNKLDSFQLRKAVRECLKGRTNWRNPSTPFPDDGSSQPLAM